MKIPCGYEVVSTSEGYKWQAILSPESHSKDGFTSERAAIISCNKAQKAYQDSMDWDFWSEHDDFMQHLNNL